jgi:uncharacterized protein YacL
MFKPNRFGQQLFEARYKAKFAGNQKELNLAVEAMQKAEKVAKSYYIAGAISITVAIVISVLLALVGFEVAPFAVTLIGAVVCIALFARGLTLEDKGSKQLQERVVYVPRY